MGKITDKQLSIIEKFSCERLTSNPKNRKLIEDFVSEKGSSLVDYLHKCAWDEDIECKTAYYLIKSSEGDVVLFFSLKCGALFDSLVEDNVKRKAKKLQALLEAVRIINQNGKEKELAIQILENYRSGRDISIEQVKSNIKMDAQQVRQLLKHLDSEKQNEQNEQIIRVGHTYPSIELVHFCTNDLMKEKWKSLYIQHPMGEVMFWKYIAPIIYETQNHIGCQYVYLFAADTSEDEILINYYNVALKFEKTTELGTNKPRYDWCCPFMCQEISKLKKYQQEYFDNFNSNNDLVV